MEKKTRPRAALDVASSLVVIGSFFLASCGPVRGTETSQPTESGPETQSPRVICPAPDPEHPNAVIFLSFTRDGNMYEMKADRLSGSDATKPDANGKLMPHNQYVNTGIDLEIPIGRSGDQLILVNLDQCLVEESQQQNLQDFFGDNPQFNDGKVGHNKHNRNPFAGQQSLRRPMRSSKPIKPSRWS